MGFAYDHLKKNFSRMIDLVVQGNGGDQLFCLSALPNLTLETF